MTPPKVSISALIYRSTVYADFVYNQIKKHTAKLLESGEAEFYFIANDASEEVLQHLRKMQYPFYVQTNQHHTDAELFAMGFGKPEYIHRVYKGWNRAIQEARGKYVCLVNSDMGFSEGWIENLLKHVTKECVVSSLLIERGHEKLGHFGDANGTGSIVVNCGKTPLSYNEAAFKAAAKRFGTPNKTTVGGVYMPLCFEKQTVLNAGGYPNGNLAGKNFNQVVAYGDAVLMEKLKKNGVRHITAWDSVAYHFQQGEQEF